MSDLPDLPDLRASDAERDATVERLRAGCTDGRLTLDEFAERLDLALRARTRVELEAVTTDLPKPDAELTPLERTPGWARIRAILGRSSRLRRWRVPARADVLAVMGACELDLREALFDGEVIELTALAVLGEVTILIPEGMEAEVTGSSFVGEVDHRGSQEPPIPGMPRLRVRARGIFGRVAVMTRPRSRLERWTGLRPPEDRPSET